MKAYSDNDIAVFCEHKKIYDTKTLLKNIIRFEFETFYNASQTADKQTLYGEFNSIAKQTENGEFNHSISEKNI